MSSASFEWNKHRYVITYLGPEPDLVQLPDGTLLKINGWLESFPPQPADLVEVPVVQAQSLNMGA